MVLNIHNKLGYIALLCIVFCSTCSALKFHMLVASRDIQDMIKNADICSKEAGYPPTALKKIVKWPISDARASKQLFECVCYRSGYTDEEGHMRIEKFLAMKIVTGTKEQIVEMLKECNKVTLEDRIETAYAMSDCLHKDSSFDVDKNKD